MDALPHEVHGLQPHPGGSGLEPGGLRLDRADGLLQLVVVQECLGEPEDGVHPLVALEAGHAERGPQVAYGAGGRGEERGLGEFVEDVRVGFGPRWFLQGTFQAAAGRVGGADGEVLAGGLAQLPDEFLVVVRVDLQEVAGGGRGAVSLVGDDPGGDAVHGGAQGVGDGVVDGGRDQRVHELQVAFGAAAGRRVGRGEDAGGAQQFGAAAGVVRSQGGQFGDEVDGDAGAEDRGGPGEPGGVDAEFLQAGDEAAAAGRAVQFAQFAGPGLDRFEFAVLHLGEEFDGLVGVAGGDGPDLAAEGGVGVFAQGGAGESGGGFRGEGAQGGGGAVRGCGDGVEVAGARAGDLLGAAGDDDQDGHLVEPLGESREPVQGLVVRPVGVVDQQHQRPVPAGEPAYGRDQAVAHALRVGLPVSGVRNAEGGAGDVVPVAEVLAGLLGQHRHQRRLQQLPYHVEGDRPEGLAAARRPHRAAACFGDAAGFGQQRGLAESGLAAEDQQSAGRGTVRAQAVDRPLDGGDLLVALPQGSRGGGRGPYLRHPATSPSRPNDVPMSSVAVPLPEWRVVAAPLAVTGDTECSRATHLSRHQPP
ncbi:hypothetical protein GCM10010104_21950 [Streptomyces indiaensis]|uniref:Uncharacterized protein n=1 Tax=Streptomyces indiaensis TaxID=284033 RepID=A0ABN3DEF0_9ACTN